MRRWWSEISQGKNIRPPIVAVCGTKNVGKTTLLVNLISQLSQQGLLVAALKHDGHDFQPDVPGTDSFRLRQAGAYGTAVYSGYRYMVTKQTPLASVEQLRAHFPEAQVILLEGGKNSPFPKIEILRMGFSEMVVGCSPHLALCTDGPWTLAGVPTVGLTDYPRLAELIVASLR
jgi:molybdopterin-guanine dinucleotide biosynthesis protein MobB